VISKVLVLLRSAVRTVFQRLDILFSDGSKCTCTHSFLQRSSRRFLVSPFIFSIPFSCSVKHTFDGMQEAHKHCHMYIHAPTHISSAHCISWVSMPVLWHLFTTGPLLLIGSLCSTCCRLILWQCGYCGAMRGPGVRLRRRYVAYPVATPPMCPSMALVPPSLDLHPPSPSYTHCGFLPKL